MRRRMFFRPTANNINSRQEKYVRNEIEQITPIEKKTSLTPLEMRKKYEKTSIHFNEKNCYCCSTKSGSEGYLAIKIIDTGMGMSEEEIGRLFNPYTQANSQVKKSFGGTGLGLWITKQIVELMHGKIFVRSKPQAGTVFTVIFPLQILYSKKVHLRNQDSEFHVNKGAVLQDKPHPGECLRAAKHLDILPNSGSAIKILILEDEKSPLIKLDQAIQQFKKVNTLFYHSFFEEWRTEFSLIKNSIQVIIVIAGVPSKSTRQVLRELDEKQKFSSPIILLTEIGMMTDFRHYENQICYPLPKNSLLSLIRSLNSFKKRGADLFPQYNLEKASSKDQSNISSTIILADDNISSCMAMRRMLSKEEKFRVVSFFNGLDPVKYYEEQFKEVALIFMDIEMPELDGIEATKKIRKFENENNLVKAVPIVALTGHNYEEVEEVCKREGMSRILTKPITKHKLMEILNLYI